MSQATNQPSIATDRRGSVLLLVLVTILIMTLATGTYLQLMQNEHNATRYSAGHQQARLLTESGIEYLKVFLGQSQSDIDLDGGLINNPAQFQGQLVVDDVSDALRGRFTVLAPDLVEGSYSGVRYGVENESAKLNLNMLVAADKEEQQRARQMLVVLPGMTDAVADAILDWLDEDNRARDFGAEQAYYQNLSSPYEPTNGPIRSLDELLFVRGVTPQLLYGLDTNRNLTVDSYERPSGALLEIENSMGEINRGWSAYLTVHSAEGSKNPSGGEKIDLNSDNLRELHGKLVPPLGEAAAKFIIAYRQFGGSNRSNSNNRVGNRSGLDDEQTGLSASGPGRPNPASAGPKIDAGSIEIDFKRKAQVTIESHLDLVDTIVTVEREVSGPVQTVESPWRDLPATYRGEFLPLLDSTTTTSGQRTIGRINVNLASRPVLLAIPGMTTAMVDQIVSRREIEFDSSLSEQRHAIWLLAEGIIDLKMMRAIDSLVTTGGDVFSGQIVGFFDAGTVRARVQIVLDCSKSKPQLVAWENLSPLGPGFDLSILETSRIEKEFATTALPTTP